MPLEPPLRKVGSQNFGEICPMNGEVRQKLYWKKNDEILFVKTHLLSLITDEQSYQEMFLLDKVFNA